MQKGVDKMNDLTKADPIGIIERAQTQERATQFMAALVKAQRDWRT